MTSSTAPPPLKLPPEAALAGALANPRRRRKGRASSALPVLSFVILIGLWQLAVRGLKIPQYILPAPTEVFASMLESWQMLWGGAQVTGSEVVLGFLLAAVISVPLAYLISSVKAMEQAFYPVIVVLQTIPKIAVAPLFIVWFGLGQMPKILLTFLLCFFPILVDSITGFNSLDPRLLYITKSMGASRFQTFRFVRLPAALPFIFSGFKVASVLAVTGAIVAEFVGASAGLGYLLLRASSNLDTALIFAVIVVLSLLGLIFSYLVEFIERLVMPWQRKEA